MFDEKELTALRKLSAEKRLKKLENTAYRIDPEHMVERELTPEEIQEAFALAGRLSQEIAHAEMELKTISDPVKAKIKQLKTNQASTIASVDSGVMWTEVHAFFFPDRGTGKMTVLDADANVIEVRDLHPHEAQMEIVEGANSQEDDDDDGLGDESF